MRISFLGSGSAFSLSKENYHANILFTQSLEDSNGTTEEKYQGRIGKDFKHLLYDAGGTIGESLHEARINIKDINQIYISHLHGDHAGGVELLAFRNYFGQFPFGVNKSKIIGHHSVLTEGWDKTWRGGLESIQGQTNTLETYFDSVYMKDNDDFDFYGVPVTPIQTVHVIDDRRFVPSYGLMIHDQNKKIFLSGDSQYAPSQMLTFFEQADVIFQDCEMAEYPKSVHAQRHELTNLHPDIKKKMWLYHYTLKTGEEVAEDGYAEPQYQTYEEVEKMILADGFAGLVKRGQEFFTEDM